MSNVRFTNKAYLKRFSRRSERLHDALEFYLKRLRCYSLAENILIKFSCANLGEDGWVASCAHSKIILNKKKTKAKIQEITIQINTNSEVVPTAKEMYSALAHECVHLKQYLKKELLYIYGKKNGITRTKYIIWKGEKKTEKQWKAFANGFYAHFPWEREAFAKEKVLLESFLASTR